MKQHNEDLESYRRFALHAAEDLRYGTCVEDRIKAAKTESEICKIMLDARRGIGRSKSTKPVYDENPGGKHTQPSTRWITYGGEQHSISEWSRLMGVNRMTLTNHINRGEMFDFEDYFRRKGKKA